MGLGAAVLFLLEAPFLTAFSPMVMESTPRDIYLRFFSLMKQFPHMMAARLSQIDYSREMAFVAIAPPGSADAGDILGVARMIADPNNERAEFAVMFVPTGTVAPSASS